MISNLDYPAVEGGVVTQAHVNLCATKGHAYHMKDGVLQDMCPRCGEVQTHGGKD